MTDDDKALVNDLLDADVITQGYGILVSLETCRKAADRIEALSAENERLRDILEQWLETAREHLDTEVAGRAFEALERAK